MIENRMTMLAAKMQRSPERELLLEGAQEIADLRRKASLSNEERGDISDAVASYEADDSHPDCARIAATLRGLLARLSPPAT